MALQNVSFGVRKARLLRAFRALARLSRKARVLRAYRVSASCARKSRILRALRASAWLSQKSRLLRAFRAFASLSRRARTSSCSFIKLWVAGGTVLGQVLSFPNRQWLSALPPGVPAHPPAPDPARSPTFDILLFFVRLSTPVSKNDLPKGASK